MAPLEDINRNLKTEKMSKTTYIRKTITNVTERAKFQIKKISGHMHQRQV